MTRILGRATAIAIMDDEEIGRVAAAGPLAGNSPLGTNGECMCNPVPNGTGGYDWTPDDCNG